MSALNAEVQKLEPSAILSLFTLDATVIGGPVLRFLPAGSSGMPVTYDGKEYLPVDVEFKGLETAGMAAPSRPTISITANNDVIQALVATWGDLNGCKLWRIRTFARFIDGEPEADPTAFFGPDLFEIDRKVSDTPTEVTWELASTFDQEGVQLPRRVMVRGTCMWRYRRWDAVSLEFDYSRAQCPYTGDIFYDNNNNVVTDPAKDRPARNLACCKTRFGETASLPFGGFPGLGRVM